MVIAIDGPAGSGKGTLARKLAAHYSAVHLDSGKLYRLVALRVEGNHVDLKRPKEIQAVFDDVVLSDLDNPRLSSHVAGNLAAKYSPQAVIRRYVNEFIRRVARENAKGIVVDGRDIGTIVLPNADVKFFVTADVTERARRRLREVTSMGQHLTYDQVLSDLESRDKADRKRKVAPLRAAPDAHLLDTTHLSIDAATVAAIEIVESSRKATLQRPKL